MGVIETIIDYIHFKITSTPLSTFSTRVYKIISGTEKITDLPAYYVIAMDASPKPMNIHINPNMEVTSRIEITMATDKRETTLKTLTNLAERFITVFKADPTLGGNCLYHKINPATFQMGTEGWEGAPIVLIATISLEVHYLLS